MTSLGEVDDKPADKPGRGCGQAWERLRTSLGEVDDKPGRGRRRKATKRDDRHAVRIFLANRKTTAVVLAGQMQRELGVTMTPRSWSNRLRAEGLMSRVKSKKSLLSAANIASHVQWASDNLIGPRRTGNEWCGPMSHLFSSSLTRVFVRMRVGKKFMKEFLAPTVKFGGGKIMVWGCFGSNGVGSLIRVEGTLRQHQYIDILQRDKVPSAQIAWQPSLHVLAGQHTMPYCEDGEGFLQRP